MKKIIFLFLLAVYSTSFSQNNEPAILKSGYLEIGKAKIYYEEKGSGIPIIMIHGGFLDRRMWDEQFDYFSKDYRVIRYDVRNHGLTTSGAEKYTDYDDLNKIMENLKIDRAIVMGLSMGGYIAIDFALAYPEKLIALIPVSTGISGNTQKDNDWLEYDKNINQAFKNDDIEGAAEIMLHAWTDGPTRTPEQVDKTMRNILREMIINTFKNWNPEIKHHSLTSPAIDRLSEIKVPVLTIYGDIDMQGIIDLAYKIEKEIPGAKKEVIKNAAHMVNMEFPEEFDEIVSKFLKNLKYHITTEQAEKMILENIGKSDFILLDVRTPKEFETGCIEGAININIKSKDFPEKIDELDKEKKYVIYCLKGGRSAKALEIMQGKGFKNVYNVLGGIKKWKEENRLINTN